MQPLEGKIAVVAGATRGAGRGIACMLGEAGATVYCTGRNSRHQRTQTNSEQASDLQADFVLAGRPETIEETAELVTQYGGVGIPHRTDHTDEAQVKALFERIEAEQGRLDILVNDIWGGDELTIWEKRFWEQSLANGLLMIERALFTHIITAHYGLPLLLRQPGGLLIEITDGDTMNYRGNVYYDLVKIAVTRLAFGLAQDMKAKGGTALALTPGFLRSEAMLEHFGVTEANWRDGAKKEPHFIASETPYFVGRAVAALAADPDVSGKTGQVFSSWGLSDEYGFSDINGERPHWGRYFAQHVAGEQA
jgi:NAD(P)-dependent dehydrogenase (short-subunit alcohol dehydrogenase family)